MLSLTRGLLRLDFSNGARVTVEGPANWRFLMKIESCFIGSGDCDDP